MLGNFFYNNPTRLYFGDKALDKLDREIKNYGKNIFLVYGQGAVKKYGIYDKVIAILEENGCNICEFPGVMPNPTVSLLYKGCEAAREHGTDLILALGGGSVCDFAKAVSVSAYCPEDPWDRYYVRMKQVQNKILPVGCIPTTAGTGSEMNGCAVITNPEQKRKVGHVFGPDVFPRFAILNPEFTFTMSKTQMANGIFDTFNHLTEQYFSNYDDSATDYCIEGFMKSLIRSSKKAMQYPRDYEARSNIMWISSWALSTLLSKGKKTDWMIHMVAQSIGAYTDAPHGATLSAITIPYYKMVSEKYPQKFVRFAVNVWGISPEKIDLAGFEFDPEILYDSDRKEFSADEFRLMKTLADKGLECMEEWMKELGLIMNIKELGVTQDMYPGILEGIKILKGGYRRFKKEDIIELLNRSLSSN